MKKKKFITTAEKNKKPAKESSLKWYQKLRSEVVKYYKNQGIKLTKDQLKARVDLAFDTLKKSTGDKPISQTSFRMAVMNLDTIFYKADVYDPDAPEKISLDNGPITNQYAGKTAEQVWEAWTEDQRHHFLSDHADQIIEGHELLNQAAISQLSFTQLPGDVVDTLQFHIQSGQYEDGGLTPRNRSTGGSRFKVEFTTSKGNTKTVFINEISKLSAENSILAQYHGATNVVATEIKEEGGGITPEAETGKEYVADTFSLDAGPEYPGYHIPTERWNGWATPVFEKETALKILADTNTPFRWEGDALMYQPDHDVEDNMNFGEHWDQAGPKTITVNGEQKTVYGVGAYNWVWSAGSDEEDKKVYSHNGITYTEAELIEFANSAAHYDREDAMNADDDPAKFQIATIEDAIKFLGEDEVEKMEDGGLIKDGKLIDHQGNPANMIFLKGFDAYTEDVWINGSGLSKSVREQDLKKYEEMLQGLKDGTVKPSNVVGTGYKNPKKIALLWLNNQIENTKNKIATNGKSDIVIRSNFMFWVNKAKSANLITEDTAKELEDSMGEYKIIRKQSSIKLANGGPIKKSTDKDFPYRVVGASTQTHDKGFLKYTPAKNYAIRKSKETDDVYALTSDNRTYGFAEKGVWEDHDKKPSVAAEVRYIEFLNKEKNFKQDRVEFTGPNSYADAVEWGRKNLENFNTDMIRIKRKDGGKISGEFSIGTVYQIPGNKRYYTIVSKSRAGDGYFYSYSSNASGKPANGEITSFAPHLEDNAEIVDHAELDSATRTINGQTYTYYFTDDKKLNIELAHYDARYTAFSEHAPQKLKDQYNKLEDRNDHYKSAVLVDKWFTEQPSDKPASKKIELTFKSVDPDTGNLIYRGDDDGWYVSVEGVMHDMTAEGEPLSPVHNTIIKEGEPDYNPDDRFARNVGSKKQGHEGSVSIKTKMPLDEFNHRLKIIKPYMGDKQYKALLSLSKGEEKDAGYEIVKRLSDIIDGMPKYYGTEKQKFSEKIVYLHYFGGGSDFYIVEKPHPNEPGIAFGYVILNGDLQMAEWGPVDINEIIAIGPGIRGGRITHGIELDFYWTPKTFGEVMGEVKPPKGDDEPTGADPESLFYGELKSELEDRLKMPSVQYSSGKGLEIDWEGHAYIVRMNDNADAVRILYVHPDKIDYDLVFSIPTNSYQSNVELADRVQMQILIDAEEKNDPDMQPIQGPTLATFLLQVNTKRLPANVQTFISTLTQDNDAALIPEDDKRVKTLKELITQKYPQALSFAATDDEIRSKIRTLQILADDGDQEAIGLIKTLKILLD